MEREIMVKDGEILKVDDSFKIIKKIAKVGGKPVFQTLYTVCKEYEEVRAMVFVPTKGHAHVKPLLCALKKSYELYGHTMPKIAFTDIVVGNQKLFEDISPSLIIDVKHVDDVMVEVTDQEHELPVYEIPSDVTVECLSSIDSIDFFIQTILNDSHYRRTRDKDVVARSNLSLADACKAVLSRKLNKDDRIRSGNWEEARLSEDQIKYAAADAYVLLEIYDKLKHFSTIGLAIGGESQVGTFVSVYAGSSKTILARGSIRSKDTVQWNSNSIEGSATIQERQRKVRKRNIAVIEITDIMLRLKSAKPPFTEVPLSSSQNSEDTPISNFNQAQIIIDDISISVDLDMVIDDQSEDEEIYNFIEQNNNTDVDTLLNVNIHHEESNDDNMSNMFPTRVLKDIFNLMDMIKVSKRREDKRAVEEYLESVDVTWDKAMLIKSNWVLKRVRTYVRSPDVLLPVVDNLFNVDRHIKCAVTGFPLFDRQGWNDTPGILFYYLIKGDSRRFSVYRCTRGTNSVEGGIHQNIIRKFNSFNAGLFLADCALADYRLRHNISVGSRNRFNIEHRSHYNPWLVQALNTLRADFDQEFIPSYTNSYGISHHLVDSNEKFGICPVSQEIIDTFSYLLPLRQDSELLSKGRKVINNGKDFNLQVLAQGVLEVSSLVAVFSDALRSTRYNDYHYLASAQGIRFALTPVHTYEEYKLYNKVVNNHFSAQNLNNYFTWVAIFKAWSERYDSKYRDNSLINQAQCDMMRSNIRNESRLVNAQTPSTFTHLGSRQLSTNVISNDLNIPVIISSLRTPQITRPARIIAPTLMTLIDSSSSFAFQQPHHSPRMQIPRLLNNFTPAITTIL
ncbi:uncharacterized protein EV154DRAFT_594948 [Mucor mucedo]|uniref:uncharacterized protein n=1 Tax=Mucor mucedo TaxID=29922 RepID=UPI00221EB924|nr:uncharacterized protein EV154DRAFT_594948 [Mucor mucedo]KAI7887943.1 hypothetical protein EV154DRAFT_594948 [Mucor mucedo]